MPVLLSLPPCLTLFFFPSFHPSSPAAAVGNDRDDKGKQKEMEVKKF